MVRTACAQVDAWNRQRRVAGLPELYVSVNCSARQLLHPGCAGRLAEILRDSGTDPSALVIELTRSVMGGSVAGAAARLQSLADTGVRLALGTGSSRRRHLAAERPAGRRARAGERRPSRRSVHVSLHERPAVTVRLQLATMSDKWGGRDDVPHDPADVPGPDAAERQLLVVEVAGHRCGLPLDAVVEIHPAVELVPLPDAPDVVVGLVNRRGSPLAVLSLRRRLGLPDRLLQEDDHLVVVRVPDRDVALLVDVAAELAAVPVVDIDRAAATGAVHARGVAVQRDRLLVVVDLSAFLSLAEAARLEHSLRSVAV